ncbi:MULTISPECIES: hypothetical protein [unclassified Leifsonia]|uniref:hypothetical protein n=1 Tax=unclassified Leifsonia TaxID=2663824 RepID=UPI0012FA4814|nr:MULTISPECIES: hypothetical protein [unclassified Leifsonia]
MSPTPQLSTVADEETAAQTRLGDPRDMSDILNPLGLLQPKLARIESIVARTLGAVVVVGGVGYLLFSLATTAS